MAKDKGSLQQQLNDCCRDIRTIRRFVKETDERLKSMPLITRRQVEVAILEKMKRERKRIEEELVGSERKVGA